MIRRPPRSTLFPLHDALPISASEIEVIELERTATDETALSKKATTVAFDFGRLTIDSNMDLDRKSTRLNSSHANISYAVFCLKKKKNKFHITILNFRTDASYS